MGQAKQRGTYEQRLAEGQARRAAELEAAQQAFEEAECNLTPKQRHSRHLARQRLAMMMALTKRIV